MLSPSVLLLLPLVLGAPASEHRLVPAALAVGFARSFATIGAFVAIFGFGTDVFGMVADLMLMLAGGILPIPAVQTGLAGAAGPVSGWTESRLGGVTTRDLPA